MSASQITEDTREIPNITRQGFNCNFYRNTGRPLNFNDVLKRVFLDFIGRYKISVTIAVNFIIVCITTLSVTQMLHSNCEQSSGVYLSNASVFCFPFVPVDRIVVDIDLDKETHCYSSKSCASLGSKVPGYNFIIGTYGFVFVELGYDCKLDYGGVPTLRIRLPVESIYNGHDFMAARKAVEKFTELLREGLECGLILHNYTLTAEGCNNWNTWCTNVLQEIVTEDSPGGIPGPKREFTVETPQNSEFNPFDLSRVYNYQHQLKVCGHR